MSAGSHCRVGLLWMKQGRMAYKAGAEEASTSVNTCTSLVILRVFQHSREWMHELLWLIVENPHLKYSKTTGTCSRCILIAETIESGSLSPSPPHPLQPFLEDEVHKMKHFSFSLLFDKNTLFKILHAFILLPSANQLPQNFRPKVGHISE